MFVRSVAFLLIATSLMGLAVASAPAGCRDITQASIQVDKYHMYGTAKEFWEESNGLSGLQRVQTICTGGSSIPSDTCITHSENFALIACLVTYPSSLA